MGPWVRILPLPINKKGQLLLPFFIDRKRASKTVCLRVGFEAICDAARQQMAGPEESPP